MSTALCRHRCVRQLLPMVLVLTEIGGAESLYAMPHQQQVLVLHSVRRDAQSSVIGERDIPRAIEEGLKQDVDYYSEYLDNARFSRADYRATFRTFLREKYKGHKFDLIIAMSTTVVQFLDKNRRELFPDTPVVFFETTPAPRLPNSTGVIAELNLRGTVDLARRLQPDLQHVFVVAGSGHNDRTYEHIARKQLVTLEPGLAVTYLSGLPTGELEKALATLPPHSVVFYLVVSRDGAGEYFHPLE